MRRRRLLWHLFPSYLLITIVAVAAVSSYAGLSLRDFYYSQTESTLEARARLVEARVGDALAGGEGEDLEPVVRDLGQRSNTRVTVILPSGRVLADSQEDAARMENHADRPEVVAAMSGKVGTSRRFSHTLERGLVYVAVPVVRSGRVVGAIRTALPRTALDQQLGAVLGQIALAAALLILFAAAVSFVVSRRLTEPITEMRSAAERFAHGGFGHNIPISHSEELAGLAESLNSMAAQLDARIRTITQQRAEQEAVLASMVEGVVALDADNRMIALNTAASGLLSVESGVARGRPIQEVVRNTDLSELAALALSGDEPVEREIQLHGRDRRYLQARGTALRDESGRRVGAVLVLNDVTRTRRLEDMRRDFVANVSHELRTPITSIKGFVETLLDDSAQDPDEACRFLRIISKHADRLDAIIEDLLFLSRIEQDSGGEGAEFGTVVLRRVADSVIEILAPAAEERDIEIRSDCDDDLQVRANAQLLEHAVANIVDNAIKYSSRGGTVWVSCAAAGDEAVLSVTDEGPGIPEGDLPRIFERFYRVDKARSREMGGTGLGLAISKHIVQAHGGRISVSSRIGQGSTFSIHLPMN